MAFTPSRARFLAKWWIALKVAPIVAAVIGVRLAISELDLEFVDSVSLFGTIVAADVFVLGFLLAGTLADYKEGERLPSDLASSIESMADEFLITMRKHPGPEPRDGLAAVAHLATGVRQWLHREVSTEAIMAQITGLNDHLRAMEPMSQPQYVTRLKQEQALIRKMVMRIETIRDTQFVVAGYAMAELGTAAVIAGFLFLEISSAAQAALFTGIVSFLLIYLVMLIHDLDNPFDHYKSHPEAARVSLHSIHDVERRLLEVVGEASGGADPAKGSVVAADGAV